MAETTARALKLLSLLQTHRHWTGGELADRLGITERTVRRDVERLRDLGYRIESAPGLAGGYRLEAGNALPPLLLDDDEAVTIAIGLRVAATQRLVDGPQTTLSALAKLEQVLPPALRRRVNALAEAVQPVGIGGGPVVSPEVLGELALASRDHERLRFDYTSMHGDESHRRVEPHALAAAQRNWYLVCWDLDRDDWRTFRVDRIGRIDHTCVLFEPRDLDADTVDEMVLVASSWSRQNVEADVVIDLDLATFAERFGVWAQGAIVEEDDADADGDDAGARAGTRPRAHPRTRTRTRWSVGGSDFREAMYGLTYIPPGVEYTTDFPEPHRSELREVLERMLRALDAAPPRPRPR